MTKNPAMIFYSKKIEEEEKNTDPFPAFFSGFSIVVQTDHGTRNVVERTFNHMDCLVKNPSYSGWSVS